MIKTFKHTFIVILTRSDDFLINYNYCRCINAVYSTSNWESEDYSRLLSVGRGLLDQFEPKSFISKL